MSAKDDTEVEALLDQMFKDAPTEFSEDELVSEEDLPGWLRDGTDQDSPSTPLTEFNFSNDQWIPSEEKKRPLLTVAMWVMILVPLSAIVGVIFFDLSMIVFGISMAIFLVLLIVLISTGIITNKKKRGGEHQAGGEILHFLTYIHQVIPLLH